jgi:predicted nucleotidyltransferase
MSASNDFRPLPAQIECRRQQIVELCRRFEVRKLDIFGSAAREDFDPARSDFDLLVEFEPDSSLRFLEQYFGFKEELEELLERSVDLVMPAAVLNPYLRESIERDRRSLYAA